jgi:hypothetical protein
MQKGGAQERRPSSNTEEYNRVSALWLSIFRDLDLLEGRCLNLIASAESVAAFVRGSTPSWRHRHSEGPISAAVGTRRAFG